MNTISSSQSSSHYTYLCSDCNTIPSIQLIDSQERHMRIHCKTCNTISNILIEEFIRIIVKEQRYGYYCNNNPKHNNSDNMCLTCNIIMCGKCIESHKKKFKDHVISKSTIFIYKYKTLQRSLKVESYSTFAVLTNNRFFIPQHWFYLIYQNGDPPQQI